MIGFAGYWYAQRTAANDIAKQLDALEIGPHKIGSTSVGLNGVVANDIEFFREEKSGEQPWLTVDRLTVEHPLLELARGPTSYNAIELAGVKATLESDSLFESDTDASFDLSELELPAKQLRVKDAQVVIVDDVKPDVIIKGIQLQLDQQGEDSPSTVKIKGEVEDLLGSKIDIAGELPANREKLSLTLAADEFEVATKQWQNLPGLPEGIDKTLTVDGKLVELGCDVTLESDSLTVDGSAKIGRLAAWLPQYSLPVLVNEGTIGFDTKQIELANLVATLDGSGEVRGKAVAEFAEFPIRATFDTEFDDVTARSLRKIVVAIPEILIAKASGTANGSVIVESSTRTTINLNADAAGTDGAYGKIKADTLGANVVIKNLIFDDQLNYESIDGMIDATAQTDQQSIPDVLTTFELDSFQQQMQIVGNGSGKLNLRMPLATAEDMRSWEMKIEGGVATGSVSGKKFVDADATVEMLDGILQFNPVNVLAVADDNPPGDLQDARNSNLQLNVRWPMVPETAQGDDASIVVSGADVPVTWLMGFLQSQIENSTTQPAEANDANQPDAANQSNAIARVNQLDGSAGFKATITLPTATPDDIYSWQVDGTVNDTKINVGDDRLQDLAASIRMSDGQLEVKNINGNFYDQTARNGSVNGAATVNLKQQSQASADLNLKQLPLPWLVSVAQELLPEYAEQLQQSPVDSLAGQIDADIKYRSSADDPMQSLEVAVRSAEMSVLGQQLRGLQLNGSFDGKQIKVSELASRIGDRGQLAAQGDWSTETNKAAGKLMLEQLSLPWLVSVAKGALPQYAEQLQQAPIDSLTGEIGADVKFQFSPNDQTQSLELSLRSAQMGVSGQQLRDFKLNGSFDGKQIKVAELSSRIGESGELEGQGDWAIETNQGAGNLNLKQFPLPLLVTLAKEAVPQYAEQMKQPPIDSLAGKIGADVKFQFSPDDETQLLELILESAQMSVSGQQLRDFKLDGSYDGKQIKVTQLKSLVGKSGEMEGRGDWSIETNQGAGNLNLRQFPLPLLVTLAKQAVPQYAEQLQQPPIDSLSGKIGADVKFQFSPEDDTQSLELVLGSPQINVSDQELRDFKLSGSFDGKQIKVAQLKSFIGEGGELEGQGDWSIETNQAAGKIEWDNLPLALLAVLADMPSPIEGNSAGQLTISTLAADQAQFADYQVAGSVGLKDLQVRQFKARDVGFDVETQNGALLVNNFRNANGKLGVDIGGKIGLAAPYQFEASGKIDKLPLTQLLSSISSVGDQVEAASLTGVLQGDFKVVGQVEGFDWKTNGKIDYLQPTYNGVALEDIKANWNIEANQWDKSKLTVEAFDGSVDLVDLENLPDSIRLKMKDIDAGQVATVIELPSKLTGRINGDLLLKNVDRPKDRSADLKVSGKSIRVGAADFGDLTLTANYLDETLKYDLNGAILAGKLNAEGSTSLEPSELATLKFPLKLTLTNASVAGLKAAAKSSSLRPLTGRLSAQADMQLGVDGTITADGRMGS